MVISSSNNGFGLTFNTERVRLNQEDELDGIKRWQCNSSPRAVKTF